MKGPRITSGVTMAIVLMACSAVVAAAQEASPDPEPSPSVESAASASPGSETPSAAGSAVPDAGEAAAAAKVSGVLHPANALPVDQGTQSVVDDVLQVRGVAFEGDELEMDDPRLGGSTSIVVNSDFHKLSDFVDVGTQAFRLTVENEGGSWSGLGTAVLYGGGEVSIDESLNFDTVQLTGAGAYEGLTAYLVFDWTEEPVTVDGVVFPGVVPPFPEPAAEE